MDELKQRHEEAWLEYKRTCIALCNYQTGELMIQKLTLPTTAQTWIREQKHLALYKYADRDWCNGGNDYSWEGQAFIRINENIQLSQSFYCKKYFHVDCSDFGNNVANLKLKYTDNNIDISETIKANFGTYTQEEVVTLSFLMHKNHMSSENWEYLTSKLTPEFVLLSLCMLRFHEFGLDEICFCHCESHTVSACRYIELE